MFENIDIKDVYHLIYPPSMLQVEVEITFTKMGSNEKESMIVAYENSEWGYGGSNDERFNKKWTLRIGNSEYAQKQQYLFDQHIYPKIKGLLSYYLEKEKEKIDEEYANERQL